MDFDETQIKRYARHILLQEVGGEGQAKLLASKVLVVGAGGLGSPLLLYLAAAGIGTLGIVDDDVVELSNLQRQIVHDVTRLGRPKVESAQAALKAINPEVRVIAHKERVDAANALRLIADYDIVADGSDNFSTRFILNDACYFAKKTLVAAAILRFDAQISTFKAHERHADGTHGPCYRCFLPGPPPGPVPSCAEAGVLGALCGMTGSLQATEVIKEILGIGQSLSGSLIVYDGLSAIFRKLRLKADPACPLCGERPTITTVRAHAA